MLRRCLEVLKRICCEIMFAYLQKRENISGFPFQRRLRHRNYYFVLNVEKTFVIFRWLQLSK